MDEEHLAWRIKKRETERRYRNTSREKYREKEARKKRRMYANPHSPYRMHALRRRGVKKSPITCTLSIAEVAEAFGLQVQGFRSLIDRGVIPPPQIDKGTGIGYYTIEEAGIILMGMDKFHWYSVVESPSQQFAQKSLQEWLREHWGQPLEQVIAECN